MELVHFLEIVFGKLCRLYDSKSAVVDDWLQAATQEGSDVGTSEMVMLQSQGSLFAYAPVLKALQRAQLPLRKFLVYPASGLFLLSP